jgi:hypothetical protein
MAICARPTGVNSNSTRRACACAEVDDAIRTRKAMLVVANDGKRTDETSPIAG